MDLFQELFLDLLQRSPKGSLSDLLDLMQEAEMSIRMDMCPLQDAFRFRARFLGHKVAHLLIDEKGELNFGVLHQLNILLKKEFYVLGPGRENDPILFSHLRHCLALLEGREIQNLLRKFSLPLCSKRAEELVRETLLPQQVRVITDAHIRRAVLAAWLTLLRQATGSCFATAPAIFVQKHMPEKFFKDLYELLSTGRIRRGNYMVPLNFNRAESDLHRPFPNLHFAPGLKAAFEIAEVKFKVRDAATPEEYLRSGLLEEMGLSEEDLRDEEYLARVQANLMAKTGGILRLSERGKKCTEWQKRFAKMRTAFLAMTDCALLRSWEYSLASLCEIGVGFTKWNLFHHLGFHPDQRDGIGSFLYQYIHEAHQMANQEANKQHIEYETAKSAAHALEAMYENASESRKHHIKAEYSNYQHAANQALEKRDRAIQRADSLANFFPSLIRQFEEKLHDHFQELFDPSIQGEGEAHLFEDAQAGFRLSFKHGRSEASLWTPIHNGDEFIFALRDFFSRVESELVGPDVIGEMTTALIQWIQKPEFIVACIRRSKEGKKKFPWEYVSGGNLQTLMQAYFGREKPFTETKCIPHSAEELLHFLDNQQMTKEPVLMHSPTHAFLFYPSLLRPDQIPLQPFTIQLFSKIQEPNVQKFKYILLEYLQNPFSEIDWDRQIALFLRLPNPLLFADTNWSHWFFGFGPGIQGLELWRWNRIGTIGFPMRDWNEWMSPSNDSPWILLAHSEEYSEL